jgi:hypothetical protein
MNEPEHQSMDDTRGIHGPRGVYRDEAAHVTLLAWIGRRALLPALVCTTCTACAGLPGWEAERDADLYNKTSGELLSYTKTDGAAHPGNHDRGRRRRFAQPRRRLHERMVGPACHRSTRQARQDLPRRQDNRDGRRDRSVSTSQWASRPSIANQVAVNLSPPAAQRRPFRRRRAEQLFVARTALAPRSPYRPRDDLTGRVTVGAPSTTVIAGSL